MKKVACKKQLMKAVFHTVLVFPIFFFRCLNFLLIKIAFPFTIMFHGMINRELQSSEWLPVWIPVVFCLLKNEPRFLLIRVMQWNQLRAPVVWSRNHFNYSGFAWIFFLEFYLWNKREEIKHREIKRFEVTSIPHWMACLPRGSNTPAKMSRDWPSRRPAVRMAATLRNILGPRRATCPLFQPNWRAIATYRAAIYERVDVHRPLTAQAQKNLQYTDRRDAYQACVIVLIDAVNKDPTVDP